MSLDFNKTSVTEEEVSSVAKEIWNLASDFQKEKGIFPAICLEGDLGAGKTRLVRALTDLFGGDPDVSSPTFNLLNEYKLNGFTLYHFDLYRIQEETEWAELGFEEIWNDPNSVCCIEWWQKAKHRILKPILLVSISIPTEMDSRTYVARILV